MSAAKIRPLPGPTALIFSALGLVTAMVAAFLSLFPFFGIFTFVPLIVGGIFTGIALILCHLERSRRVLPLIAVGLLLQATILLVYRLRQWGEGFKELINGT